MEQFWVMAQNDGNLKCLRCRNRCGICLRLVCGHPFLSQREFGVLCQAILIANKIQLQEYSRGGDPGGREHPSYVCWRNPNGNLYAPYSIFDADNRKLNQNWIDNDWNDNWAFVGFCDFLS